MSLLRSFFNPFCATLMFVCVLVAGWAQVSSASTDSATVVPDNRLAHKTLTEDWGGRRNWLGERGVTVDAAWTQFIQGGLGGGGDERGNYGGKFDARLALDGEKIGLWRGLTMDARLEYRYLDTVNDDRIGTLLPVNFAMSMPQADGETLGLSTIQITQRIGERGTLFAGKLCTLEKWRDPFVDGMGLTRFQNTAFVGKVIPAGAWAYSAWAVGGIYAFESGSRLIGFVQSPNNVPTTVGLKDIFNSGISLLLEFQQPTRFLGKPGRHVVDLTYSNKERTSLDRNDAVFPPTGGIAPGTKDNTWGFYYEGYQYVQTLAGDDQRGWGLFWNISVSDGNPNPIELFWFAGVGGNGSFSGRPLDRWGAGYFEAHLSDTMRSSLASVVNLREKECGAELYYNISVTHWFEVTPDVQYILPGSGNRDWTTIVGLRARAIF